MDKYFSAFWLLEKAKDSSGDKNLFKNQHLTF
jgi:hypothetical protein